MPSSAVQTPVELPHPGHRKTSFWALALGSIGVVYGDIGTSPLYALKESLVAARGEGALTHDMIYGVLSLMLWALIVIVTLKYVIVILRADNDGEGGTLSLMALAHRALGDRGPIIGVLGMIGAALFYGDAMITPAISVLSAVEGLELVTPHFKPYVVQASVVILIALFVIQNRGTAKVAAWFGPIIVVWFLTLALSGLAAIMRQPEILQAVNPVRGATFLATHGWAGAIALGAVFLTVTGAEALYADLGHFGRGPIRFAWLYLVFPSLVLNYLGQGALLLGQAEAIESPFFRLYPDWALLPVVLLATIATVIASQAVITGAYSVTQQAIQLGLLPRLEIRRTSESEKGQIYLPVVNWLLLVPVVLLTTGFRSSGALASAYGIAVTGTMVVTVVLATIVALRVWQWTWQKTALVMGPFFLIDTIFLGANALKIGSGGWMPLLVGSVLLGVMLTWRRGSRLLAARMRKEELSLPEYVAFLLKKTAARVPGTAVFMTRQPDAVPTALMHNLKHNKILHQRIVIVAIETTETPRVAEAERGSARRIADGVTLVRLRFGFMEEPDVPRALQRRRLGLELNPAETSYFLSRRVLRPARRSELPYWQDYLFIWLSQAATDASKYFRIPSDRVIEIGTQIAI